MLWFRHLTNAMNDVFIQELERKFGDTGYAFWFKTLELIGSDGKDGVLIISEDIWRRVIHSHRIDHLRRLYTFSTEHGKLEVTPMTTGLLRVSCPKFAEFADNYTKYNGASAKTKQRHFGLSSIRREENRTDTEVHIEDFDALWKLYPNRQGRKAALRHFAASVKTKKNLEDIQKALTNYLASGTVRKGYVKNGSTWFNQWEDWIDPTPEMMQGSGSTKPPQQTESRSLYRRLP